MCQPRIHTHSARSSLQRRCVSRHCGKGERRESLLFSPFHHRSLPPSLLSFVFSCILSRLQPSPPADYFSFSPSPLSQPRNLTTRQRQTTQTHTDRSKRCMWMSVNELGTSPSSRSFSFGSGHSSGGFNRTHTFLPRPKNNVISECVSISGRRSPNMTGRHLKVESEAGTTAGP